MDTAKNTTAATSIASPSTDASDLESDLRHLAHLLDATVWHMQDMDHSGSGPNGRSYDLDRANAFIWIARDMADNLAADAAPVSRALAKAGA